MICLKCESEDFVLKPDAAVEQEFRGETFKVTSPVMECKHCGWQALDEGQMDELGRRTSDAFRKRNNLLTSEEIKALRMSLRMSQREFAEFLRVGEASVKRWENWKVQDASSDELIRLKCMMAKAVSKTLVTTFSYDFILPGEASACIAWHEFVQFCPQNVSVLPSFQGFSGLGVGIGDYFSWLADRPRSQISSWFQPQSSTPLPEASFHVPVQPPISDGRSPPDIWDACRFSFPIPSSVKKASEKKTIMIQNK